MCNSDKVHASCRCGGVQWNAPAPEFKQGCNCGYCQKNGSILNRRAQAQMASMIKYHLAIQARSGPAQCTRKSAMYGTRVVPYAAWHSNPRRSVPHPRMTVN